MGIPMYVVLATTVFTKEKMDAGKQDLSKVTAWKVKYFTVIATGKRIRRPNRR